MATGAQLRWALSYDGYERIAESPSELRRVLEPAIVEYERSGRVPAWCGVDLLRAWAFYRQREHHADGMSPMAPDFYAVLDAIRAHPSATVHDMPPGEPRDLPADWAALLTETLQAPYWAELMAFIEVERALHDVTPPPEKTFRAFELTPVNRVRVVILGQDPYPTPGNADGLAFSVGNPTAPSPDTLVNISTELASDLGKPVVLANDLTAWAEQGVLLLNTALTLRLGDRGDQKKHTSWRWNGQGWHTFTDAVIKTVSDTAEPTVFILWGGLAHKKAPLIGDKHFIIATAHPARISAAKGFFSSRPFTRANDFLSKHGRGEIDWAAAVLPQ